MAVPDFRHQDSKLALTILSDRTVGLVQIRWAGNGNVNRQEPKNEAKSDNTIPSEARAPIEEKQADGDQARPERHQHEANHLLSFHVS